MNANEKTPVVIEHDPPAPAGDIAISSAPMRPAIAVPRTLMEVKMLAEAIAAVGQVPRGYTVKTPEGKWAPDTNRMVVGIMAGMEVGLTPLAALQSIAIVNGTPTIWGDAMMGLVLQSGLLADYAEEWTNTGKDEDGLTVTVRVSRKHSAIVDLTRSFSQAQAAKAGLLEKDGPWRAYTRRMMLMRARAFALRDAFGDILKGLRSTEEAEDHSDEPAAPKPTRALVEAAKTQPAALPAPAEKAMPAAKKSKPETVEAKTVEVEAKKAEPVEAKAAPAPEAEPAPEPEPEPVEELPPPVEAEQKAEPVEAKAPTLGFVPVPMHGEKPNWAEYYNDVRLMLSRLRNGGQTSAVADFEKVNADGLGQFRAAMPGWRGSLNKLIAGGK